MSPMVSPGEYALVRLDCAANEECVASRHGITLRSSADGTAEASDEART
jgi:hypothetical protein